MHKFICWWSERWSKSLYLCLRRFFSWRYNLPMLSPSPLYLCSHQPVHRRRPSEPSYHHSKPPNHPLCLAYYIQHEDLSLWFGLNQRIWFRSVCNTKFVYKLQRAWISSFGTAMATKQIGRCSTQPLVVIGIFNWKNFLEIWNFKQN